MSNPSSLILHVGLPKTGSSATQFWADGNRRQLLECGVCYPKTTGQPKPKHQALVSELMQNSQRSLGQWIEHSPTSKLFLSTEGLSNHVYDFSDEALEEFRWITKGVQVIVFVVFRERAAWLRSCYKQSVLNAPNPQYLYGTPINFEDFAASPRIARLADRQSLVERLGAAFGAEEIVEADYEQDWHGRLLATLGIQSNKISMSLPVSNESASDDTVELVRQYNGFSASPEERVMFLNLLNAVVGLRNIVLLNIKRPNGLKLESIEHQIRRLSPHTAEQGLLVDQMLQHIHGERHSRT